MNRAKPAIKYSEMATEQLARATREFDRPLAVDDFAPVTHGAGRAGSARTGRRRWKGIEAGSNHRRARVACEGGPLARRMGSAAPN